MNVRHPYRAVICGEECIVKGWQGNKLLTDEGIFFVGHIYGDWQIQTQRIFEVVTIQSDNQGSWLVNGKPFSMLEHISMGVRLSSIPKDENLRVYKDRVCAAAWVETGNAPNVTELLDKIVNFWKTASLPVIKSNEEPSLSKALGVLSRGLFDIQRYKELFPTWSKPIWLTKFQCVGQIANPIKVEIVSPPSKNVSAIAEKISTANAPKMIADKKAVVESEKPAPEFFTSVEAAAEYIGVSKRTIFNWKKCEWLKVEQNGKKIRIARSDLEKCKNRQ